MSQVNTIQQHNYLVEQPELQIPEALVKDRGLERFCDFEEEILNSHLAGPIDIIVGDDVSGRVPTLFTHRFLRLERGGGSRKQCSTYFLHGIREN
jgi:hypothetical protein